MGSVLETTYQIKAGTSEIADASGDLARRTEQQAAALEETAASVDEITVTTVPVIGPRLRGKCR